MKKKFFGIVLFLALMINGSAFAAWQNNEIRIDAFTTPNKVLLKLEPLNGGHILWDNPGDLGTPTTFEWNTPAKRLNETTPQKFIYDDIIGQYGYETPAYYLFELSAPEKAEVKISWTICKEECIPQSTDLKITPNPNTAEFEKAEKTFPQNINENLTVRLENEKLILELPKSVKPEDKVHFVPDEKGIISPLTEQIINRKNNGLKLKIESEYEAPTPSRGLLFINSKAWQVTLQKSIPEEPWALLLLLAFLGGIILNFMPCVFPILSLKALALTKTGKNPKDGLLYMAGVLTCFALMATVLCLLRRSGAALGWGFQLRSPIFVSLMLFIFIVVFLLMTDIIKIKGRLQTLFDRFAAANAFLTGLFAVLIASPCSGPLLGAAVGYALLRSSQACLPIFLSMGLGYALPFTLLEVFPQSLRRILPAPGRWMGHLKKILAIPVLLTCLWLVWLLYGLISDARKETHGLWQPYDQSKIENLVADGKPVLIDFTAKWCLTCLLNEKAVLESATFEKTVKTCGIALFKADWTPQSESVTKALESYGRASVPLYVYYPSKGKYVILPQLLTINILEDYLNDCFDNTETSN